MTNLWPAPFVSSPVNGVQIVPGSKSITNRALALAAIADSPSRIEGALVSRDTELMADALNALGIEVVIDGSVITITPGELRPAEIDCGLAGTVMRFVPGIAALVDGDVAFDGDEQARVRPMAGLLDGLRQAGVDVTGDTLPFVVHGDGHPVGGEVRIDSSASSQFVSGLLLTGARFEKGISVTHIGEGLPSVPHIEMTLDMLKTAGVEVSSGEKTWSVKPGPVAGRTWVIEPDLSNATPFLAAAAVTGGTVTVPHWPAETTQPGDGFRAIAEQMGCTVKWEDGNLSVTGPADGQLTGIDYDMSNFGELTPTVTAMCALATTPSKLTGVGHLRGHETDRLAALAAEINRLGGDCEELDDGLIIRPRPLTGDTWYSYADHRMATAGAIIGLKVDGVEIENVETTAKTLPGFADMWSELVHG